MSLSISPSSADLNLGGTVTFTGVDGTAPYRYTLLDGEGSLNETSGLFTAEGFSGTAVVEVTDSAGATARAQVVVNSALTRFCRILQLEMGLDEGQVYLWDQKLMIPPDDRLYIAVGVLNCKPFGSAREMLDGESDLQEVLSVNMLAALQIEIMSRGPQARDRKEEVILALKSIRALQQQEAYGFMVAQLSSSFVNLSQIDGAAIPYRFSISVNVQYSVTKTKSVPFYDSFSEADVVTEP